MLRCAMFYSIIALAAMIIFPGHLRESYRSVARMACRCGAMNHLQQVKLLKIWHFLQEYHRVSGIVLVGSRKLFGSVLFVFLLIHTPINIYPLTLLVFTKVSTATVAAIWAVLLTQSLALAVVLGPLAYNCAVYHRPTKWLPSLQGAMKGRRSLMLKFKCDHLYSRLSYGPKISVSIGPFGGVTYWSIFEVCHLFKFCLNFNFKFMKK